MQKTLFPLVAVAALLSTNLDAAAPKRSSTAKHAPVTKAYPSFEMRGHRIGDPKSPEEPRRYNSYGVPIYDTSDEKIGDVSLNGKISYNYDETGLISLMGLFTRQALNKFKRTDDPLAGSIDPQTAGNGSLMRLAPVAIRFFSNRPLLRDVAARQSRTTHAAPEAVDACVAYAELIADAIEGRPLHEVLANRETEWAGAIATLMAGSWRGKERHEIRASGYVAHSLEASLWCLGRTQTYADAVLLAANLGEDADTTAAITGQLAGAHYGLSGIPAHWRERVAWSPRIVCMAEGLLR